MTFTSTGGGLRRTTGALFVVGALAFAASATALSSTFNWPDILREPGSVVLPAFVAGGTSLVWTWFATAVDAAWTAQHAFGGSQPARHTCSTRATSSPPPSPASPSGTSPA